MELSNPQAHSQAPFCHGRVFVTREFISCKRLQWTPRSFVPSFSSIAGGRIGEAKIVTKKTKVVVKINLGGRAVSETNTGIPFLDHMLDLLASHGLFDVHVKAVGDIISDDYYRTEDVGIAMGTLLASHGSFDVHVKATGDSDRDDYHITEDVAMSMAMALKQALGDRIGINQLGCFSTVLDDALVLVSLDLSGRPHLSYDLQIPRETIGTYDPQLVEHFFLSLVNTFGMTLHIRQFAGRNSNHILEATFKAFARALRQATEYDARRHDSVPRFSFGSLVQNFKSSYGHL
ncbi:UNVERIFIED_CONTAM: Imidazoleglycerol-phosphate dehydratase, chloroplastic [Sesamum angustifolium]|uniref:Imidazoleglycerol-phosphate dehydratase, chloroplastic n=1 Tax=Sesamum angustifolium TaxID=2727405 RepID=A0AAW2LZR7_9LAMI